MPGARRPHAASPRSVRPCPRSAHPRYKKEEQTEDVFSVYVNPSQIGPVWMPGAQRSRASQPRFRVRVNPTLNPNRVRVRGLAPVTLTLALICVDVRYRE